MNRAGSGLEVNLNAYGMPCPHMRYVQLDSQFSTNPPPNPDTELEPRTSSKWTYCGAVGTPTKVPGLPRSRLGPTMQSNEIRGSIDLTIYPKKSRPGGLASEILHIALATLAWSLHTERDFLVKSDKAIAIVHKSLTRLTTF